MNDKRMEDICNMYIKKLQNLNIDKVNHSYEHMIKMLEQIPDFLLAGKNEKASRWLGFVQGAMWSNNIYSIEAMKEHNKPTKNMMDGYLNERSFMRTLFGVNEIEQ